jgi:hypothetical protein
MNINNNNSNLNQADYHDVLPAMLVVEYKYFIHPYGLYHLFWCTYYDRWLRGHNIINKCHTYSVCSVP